MARALALGVLAGTAAHAFLPFQNPPGQWGPDNYAAGAAATISMFCNQSGPLDLTVAPSFGIASIDWSNQKRQWAATRPMDCEERLASQAAAIKDAAPGPNSRVFAYRNLVKALPWFAAVRAKLVDPAFSGFFLHFKPGGSLPNGSYHVPACDDTYSPPLCTAYYHDQEQSPAVPTPSDPNPDGSCVGTCDCGSVPCGEYLYDWRNGSMLLDWVLAEVIGGPNGMGNPAIDGYFVDDFWCANIINGTGSCTDPVQGPTEVDAHNQADMGLTDQDVADITRGWLAGMTAAQAAILAQGGYTWSLFPGQDNANAEPVIVNKGNCAATMARACNAATNPWQSAPLMHGMNLGSAADPLPTADADIAAFLLARGPWAFTGAGEWGMSWDPTLPLPTRLAYIAAYGQPTDAVCVPAGGGVFTRRFTAGSVQLDCTTYTATFS